MPSTWIDWYSTIAQSFTTFTTEQTSIDIGVASTETMTIIRSTAAASTLHPLSPTTQMPYTNTDSFADVPYEDYKYRPETYIVPIIFGLIFVAGLMGNGMLIAVFVKHRAMRNVPNT